MDESQNSCAMNETGKSAHIYVISLLKKATSANQISISNFALTHYKLNKNKHVLSHSSGGYKPDISVFTGLVPSGICDKTLVSSFFPSFW